MRPKISTAIACVVLATACSAPDGSRPPEQPHGLPEVPIPDEFRPIDNDCSRGHLYLTFDDGPNVYTEPLLDRLKALNIKATFFVLGERVAGREGTLRRELAEGHSIQSHGWDHTDMVTGENLEGEKVQPWGEEQVRDQIQRTQDVIRDATGVAPRAVRPPYGAFDATVIRAIKAERLSFDDPNRRSTIEPNDWAGASSEQIVDNIVQGHNDQGRGLRANSVVVQHDGAYDATYQTIGAMQGIVDVMNEKELCSTNKLITQEGRVLP